MTVARNLVLIGMPASGKSTVGVLAAKALGLDFIDTDILLQKQEGLKLPALLERDGSSGFLALENRLLTELSATSSVISTGGSAVYCQQGMENLRRHGTVLWLDVPITEIERRLSDVSTRGIVLAPGQSLRELNEERAKLYQRWADLRLRVEREDLETTVGRVVLPFIAKALESRF